MGLTRIRAEQISDIDYKQAVRVIQRTNVALAGSAPSSVDSVNLSVNDRVLVSGQDAAAENGIYRVQTLGTGSNGTWVRTSDANADGEIEAGMIIMVTEGDVYKDTQWKLTTNNPIIIGTTPLTFVLNAVSVIGGENTQVQYNQSGVLAGSANLTFDGSNLTVGGNVTANYFIGDGSALTGIETDLINVNSDIIPLANLTYSLGNATNQWANIYVGGNTIFLGNLQLKDAGANTLGVYAADGITPANILADVDAANIVGTVANATYSTSANLANFSTIAFAIDGSNVSGTVANATYSLTANLSNFSTTAFSVAGANVTGTVANASYSIQASISDTANSVAGANVTGTVGLAQYVTQASQGNITSVGNLVTLTVESNTSNEAVRITQIGTGNALKVEDEANPDSTPFVIAGNGSVGVRNVATPAAITANGKMVLGDSINNANIGNVLNFGSTSGVNAFQPINLIDTSAVIKVVRLDNTTNGPGVELQQWDTTISTQASYWDMYTTSSGFAIRDRLGTARDRLVIDTVGRVLIGSNASISSASANLIANVANLNLQVLGSGYFSGNVGIGTSNITAPFTLAYTSGTPLANLMTTDAAIITANASAPGFAFVVAGNTSSQRGVFKGTRARGTLESPAVPQDNDAVVTLLGAIYDGNVTRATAGIELTVDGAVSDGVAPQRISMLTGNTNTRIERMQITSEGRVAVNTADPDPRYTLQVTPLENNSNKIAIGIFGANTDYTNGIEFGESSTKAGGIYWRTTGNLLNITTYSHSYPISFGNNWLHANTSGNIGIGNTSPQDKLSVAGTGYFSGNVSVGNLSATNISGTLTTASQPNITSIGTLGSLTVTGNVSTGNVSGTAGTFTNVAGTLTTAEQPNITSVGTLGNLTVSGNLTVANANATSITIDTTNANIANIANIQSWTYANKNFSVAAQDSEPRGVFFKIDGTSMYVVGQTGDDIIQYNLSSAWDVTSAVYSNAYVVTAQDTTPYDLYIDSSGTRMYVVGGTNDRVYQYALGSAWDVGTASYVANVSVTAQETDPNAVYFKSDGTRMFVMGTVGDDINQYNLSSAWDITTATYSKVSTAITTYESSPQGISFSADGSKMWVVGSTFARITEFLLPTPWDVGTITFNGYVNVGLLGIYQVAGISGLFVDTGNNVVYISDYQNDRIFQLSTDIPAPMVFGNILNTQADMVVGQNLTVNQALRINGTVWSTSTATLGAVSSTNYASGSSTSAISLLTGSTSGSINFATGLTSGILTIGGTAQTGNIVLGRSTANNRIIIGGGTTASGATQTIDFGTGGAAGSNTNINIGSASLSGAVTTITVSGNIVNGQANGVGNIGSATGYFNTVFAKATSAQYADLAEIYIADADYPPGTVVAFGGAQEITQSLRYAQTSVAGVVSTNPAYIMNASANGLPVALQGRVPCRVTGTIRKGDLVSASDTAGVATRLEPRDWAPGAVIGKALGDHDGDTEGMIEVVVGRV